MTSIDVQDLTKEYGSKRAVDHLTFSVLPGRVTGFLGPNGAGKSTTMRLVLGLDRPTSGTATLGGRAYAGLHEPLREVGALLDAGPRTDRAPPATICGRSPRATASLSGAWTRCWRRRGSPPSRAAG